MNKILPFWYLCLCVALLSSCMAEAKPALQEEDGVLLPAATPLLTSVQSQDVLSSDTVTLKVALRQDIYQSLIDQFMVENPGIRIQYVDVFRVDTLAANEVAREADIVLRPFGPAYVVPDPEQLPWLDVRPFIDADPAFQVTDFYSNTLEVGSIGSRVYVVPQVIVVPFLKYNKNVWQSRGLPQPEPDWQWSDLRAALQQFNQTSDEESVYGFFDPTGYSALVGEFESAGIDPVNISVDQMRFDNPIVVDALRTVAALAKSKAVYILNDSPNNFPSRRETSRIIQTQQVALFNSLFVDQTTQLEFSIGTLPTITQTDPSLTTTGFSISAGTQYPEAAWRLVSYLSREDPVPAYLSDGVPARKSLATRANYWDNLDIEQRVAIETSLARPPVTERVPDSLYEHLDLLTTALQAILVRNQSPEQAATNAQAQLDQQRSQIMPTLPAPSPFIVDTAVPEETTTRSTSVSFAAIGLDASVLDSLAKRYTEQNTAVQIQTSSPQNNVGSTFSEVAAANDCFAWFAPPTERDDAYVLDLQPLLDHDPVHQVREYPPGLLTPFRRNGRILGLPLRVDLPAVRYRPTQFDFFGVPTPSLDWTLEDFYDITAQLTSEDGQVPQYGFVDLGYQTDSLRRWIQTANVVIAYDNDDTLSLNFTNPEVINAINRYVLLLQQASPHQRITGYTQSNIVEDVDALVEGGRAALWYGPNLVGPVDDPVLPFPRGPNGALPAPEVTGALYISKDTQHIDECWQWLTFLSREAAVFGGFPARRSVAESSEYIQQAPPGTEDVYRTYSSALNQVSGTPDIDMFNHPQLDLYWFYRAIDLALQGKSLVQGMDTAQVLTEQFLACIRSGEQDSICATNVDTTYQGTKNPPLGQ